jgi:hypothetical protein
MLFGAQKNQRKKGKKRISILTSWCLMVSKATRELQKVMQKKLKNGLQSQTLKII